MLGIGIDVTETRHTEKLLRESEQRFRAIFASVSDGIFVYDIGYGARSRGKPEHLRHVRLHPR